MEQNNIDLNSMEQNNATMPESNMTEEIKPKKKGKKALIIIIVVAVVLILALGAVYYFTRGKTESKKTKKEIENSEKYTNNYRLSGNGIEDFDIKFLTLENKKENVVYSPLSIKYTLAMLNEASDKDTKAQIEALIGDYSSKKYTNSNNISLANAMFVKESYKDNINKEYVDKISSKYNAEVVYDKFTNADTINNWISNKTFNLINKVFEQDISSNDFILTNALAIDMQWKNALQHTYGDISNNPEPYHVSYAHENAGAYIATTTQAGEKLDFSGKDVKSQNIGAAINKYDIIKELGEDKIKETVNAEYEKWLETDEGISCKEYGCDAFDIDTYIAELKENYKRLDTSTDFTFYTDDNIKVFAKDLRQYDGVTLQYIGIMPNKTNLDSYINDLTAKDLNSTISKLKKVELGTFEEGKVTIIEGSIPLFNFDYKLNLKQDLNELGVTDVFDSTKANISKMTKQTGAYITDVDHKATIEFENEGIKAAAVSVALGSGDGGSGFDYKFDVPIERINLTFDKPYMFIIIDKESKEVWFAGTVYEPKAYDQDLANKSWAH